MTRKCQYTYESGRSCGSKATHKIHSAFDTRYMCPTHKDAVRYDPNVVAIEKIKE